MPQAQAAIADNIGITELEEEARRAAATQQSDAHGGPDGPPAGWLSPLAVCSAARYHDGERVAWAGLGP